MPNWCMNVATFAHEDLGQIEKLAQAFRDGNPFNTFVPIGEWEYGKACEAWGTKWETQTTDVTLHENMVSVNFDTAWAPPISFFKAMEELGFGVEAYYYEPGMAFCGAYQDGSEAYYEIQGDSNWVVENIPSDIDEMFAISEGMEMWEEEEKNED